MKRKKVGTITKDEISYLLDYLQDFINIHKRKLYYTIKSSNYQLSQNDIERLSRSILRDT